MPSNNMRSVRSMLESRQSILGRTTQIDEFIDNLTGDEDSKHLIINIFGPSGIGKTTLMEYYSKVAKKHECLTAWISQTQEDVLDIMEDIANQFEQQGHSFKNFLDKLRSYKQKRYELETDKSVPQNIISALSQTLAMTGISAIHHIIEGNAPLLEEEHALALEMGQLSKFLYIRFKEDALLVQEPKKILSQIFVQNLQKEMSRQTVVLFFDKHERRHAFLDSWIINILSDEYGTMYSNILFCIAGQKMLDKVMWSNLEPLIHNIELKPLNDGEIKEYLSRKGVRSIDVVNEIVKQSKGIPMLLVIQSSNMPQKVSEIIDFNNNSIEKILDQIIDPQQRQLALLASLPRILNLDIVNQLGITGDPDINFAWLKSLNFVGKSRNGWEYHELIRFQFLHYIHQETPENWSKIHNLLAKYYSKLEARYSKSSRQSSNLKFVAAEKKYHELCSSFNISLLLEGFLESLSTRLVSTLKYVEMAKSVAEDTRNDEIEKWVNQMQVACNDAKTKKYSSMIQLLTKLQGNSYIAPNKVTAILDWRAYFYSKSNQPKFAIADLSKLIEVDNRAYRAYINRAWVYFVSHDYLNALSDIDKYTEIKGENNDTHGKRALFFLAMKDYNKSWDEIKKAIEMSDTNGASYQHWVGHRAEIAMNIGKFTEAIRDINSLLAENVNITFGYFTLGEIYAKMKKCDDAIVNFQKAMNSKNTPNIEHKCLKAIGHVYLDQERYNEASDYFTKALLLSPKCGECWKNLIAVYGIMHPRESIPFLIRSIPIDYEANRTSIIYRANALMRARFIEEAIDDFELAILKEPLQEHYSQKNIGELYMQQGQYEKALIALVRSVQVQPTCQHCWGLVAKCLFHLYTPQQAEEEYSNIIIEGVHPDTVIDYKKSGLIKAKENDFIGEKSF